MTPVSLAHRLDGTLRVVLAGDIMYPTDPNILVEVQTAIALRQPSAINVDLSGVPLIDTTGIGLLLNLMQTAHGAGATYRVEHPNSFIHEVLTKVGLHHAFGLS
jgi:anti-sigma B factor antagonist